MSIIPDPEYDKSALTGKEREFHDHVVEASTLILNGTYRTLATYFDPYISVVAFVRVAAVIASRSCTRRQLKTACRCGLKEFDMIKAGTKPGSPIAPAPGGDEK